MKKLSIPDIIKKYQTLLEEKIDAKVKLVMYDGDILLENPPSSYYDTKIITPLVFRFEYYTRGTDYPSGYAQSKLQQLPGCCGVVVSFNAIAGGPIFHGKKVGQLMHRMRIELAEALGYTVMMCTDRDANVPQKHILDKYGWAHIQQFTNKRTGNAVNISTILVDDAMKAVEAYEAGLKEGAEKAQASV